MHGHRHVVLDPNNMQTGSRLVSIGQIKICRDQSMLAYTVDTGDGSEVYDAVISIIGMASSLHSCFTPTLWQLGSFLALHAQ